MSLPMKSGPVTIGDQLIRPPARVNRRIAAAAIAAAADRLCQLAYIAAYRILRIWWFLRRPKHRGALIALWHDGELLMVRCSYRPRWDLPGGGVEPGEDARSAALREIEEEIGLTLPADKLRLAQEGEILWQHRHDHVTIFEFIAHERPSLRIDNREIIAAAFRPPFKIRSAELSPHLARYLAGYRARHPA